MYHKTLALYTCCRVYVRQNRCCRNPHVQWQTVAYVELLEPNFVGGGIIKIGGKNLDRRKKRIDANSFVQLFC